MWWLRGHQLSKSAVKTSKACSRLARTVMLVRTAGSFVGSGSVMALAGTWLGTFDSPLEIGERRRPELVEVLAQGCEGLGIELVDPPVPLGAVDHQIGVLEDAQMLRDRRAADGEIRRQLADGKRALTQLGEDRPASGVADGVELGLLVSVH